MATRITRPSGRALLGLLTALALCGIFLTLTPTPASAQTVCSQTYTTNADFDLGNLQGVNHETEGQLELNPQVSPPPFIWIANSDRGTVVRIDVEDGSILGEYRTAPSNMSRNPSRTTVDLYGNVWVTNRDEAGFVGGVRKGSIIKIGLVIGGTRCDASGNPDADGGYLKPPFTYSTAVDRDGDGLIRTSFGLYDTLSWNNTDGDDTYGGISNAEDECILIYKRTAGTHARHVSIDANNDVWVGGYGNLIFEKLDGDDGSSIGSSFYAGCGAYGGLIDGAGVLWSAGVGSYRVFRYDPSTSTGSCIYSSSAGLPYYGMAVDNGGNVWVSLWSLGYVEKFSPSGAHLAYYPCGGYNSRGVAVTRSDNNIWVANSASDNVVRMNSSGSILATITVGNEPTGLAVDANGKVWVTNYYSDNAMRIDPATNTVDLTVELGSTSGPYNYSDMTGAVALGATSLQGSWTVVQNSGAMNTLWEVVDWTASEPTGTDVRVEVRASNNAAALAAQPFVTVDDGVNFSASNITGQYLEARVTLLRSYGVSETPVVYDVTVNARDVTDPVITLASTPVTYLTPNHEYQTVSLSDIVASVTDNCTTELSATSCWITSVESDELEDGTADGNTLDDIVIASDCKSVDLRAERCGNEDGRVYTIHIAVLDATGNETTAAFDVTVPHSNNGVAAVKGDPLYTEYCSSTPKRLAPEGSATLTDLEQNVPNPTTGLTEIGFTNRVAGSVLMAIYDGDGRMVAKLVDGVFEAGRHVAVWDGRDMTGAVAPSGSYTYALVVGGERVSRRLAVVR